MAGISQTDSKFVSKIGRVRVRLNIADSIWTPDLSRIELGKLSRAVHKYFYLLL